MHTEEIRHTTIVEGGFPKRNWIENSRGERISRKFDAYHEEKLDNYVRVSTNKHVIIFNMMSDKLLSEEKGFFSNIFVHRHSKHVYSIKDYSKTGRNITLYDDIGNVIPIQVEDIGDVSNGMIYYQANGNYGFMDEKGNPVITPAWERVSSFHDNGKAIVTFKEFKRIAVIDKTGSYILPPCDYSRAEFVTSDLLRVYKDGFKGVIDITGKVIIPVGYDVITLKSGYFEVQRRDKHGLIDIKGNCIFECIYPEIIETEDKFVVHDFVRQEVMKTKEVNK